MELFGKATKVKLSNKDKYLVAVDDQENVAQSRDGGSKNALWEVEFEEGKQYLRFRSCYGKYLTASAMPFLPGSTRKKVLQTITKRNNPSILWEPIRDGFSVRLKTMSGHFLRPNGGLPPWRNSVTHDVPQRMGRQEKILWYIEVVEAKPKAPRSTPSVSKRIDFQSKEQCPPMHLSESLARRVSNLSS